MILGKIEPEYAASELNEICENISSNQKINDVYHPIMGIWYYFDEDLYYISIDEYAVFNTGLSDSNIEGYILKVIHQFQYMLLLDLDADFMSISLEVENVKWDMKDYEGRVRYLKKQTQMIWI